MSAYTNASNQINSGPAAVLTTELNKLMACYLILQEAYATLAKTNVTSQIDSFESSAEEQKKAGIAQANTYIAQAAGSFANAGVGVLQLYQTTSAANSAQPKVAAAEGKLNTINSLAEIKPGNNVQVGDAGAVPSASTANARALALKDNPTCDFSEDTNSTETARLNEEAIKSMNSTEYSKFRENLITARAGQQQAYQGAVAEQTNSQGKWQTIGGLINSAATGSSSATQAYYSKEAAAHNAEQAIDQGWATVEAGLTDQARQNMAGCLSTMLGLQQAVHQGSQAYANT